ncbi:MAG TPA: hypothetical protein VHX38_20705 [Pseudonocardiaceae bacterium]|jgi:hypothetical protein|nr:hypothetical protein [Pseudonocardiaceae bacterium]
MPRIGITGHSKLTAASVPLVAKHIRATLDTHQPDHLVGLTCLARGADQVFARVVLDLGGSVEVVLPAADYRERKVKPDNAAEFDELISKAAIVHTMPFDRSNADAYMAASEHILSAVDRLIAVWDGQPSGGYGGTADVVEAATKRGTPVTVIWPDGAERE